MEVVNLNVSANAINESFLTQFGAIISIVLQRLLTKSTIYNDLPITIRGTRNQVDSFIQTLSGEKKYYDAFVKNKLADPSTHRVKSNLDKAVANFEKETGLTWPLK